jgi:acetylornithine/N-succinyldiaminopimelate aminotransferase
MIGIELDRPCGELTARALDAGLLINVTAGARSACCRPWS